MTEQLAFVLDAPAHRAGRDLDFVAHELEAAQQAALDAALRATQAAPRCVCPRPLDGGEGRCVWCGRGLTS